jgi:hypothetical protein
MILSTILKAVEANPEIFPYLSDDAIEFMFPATKQIEHDPFKNRLEKDIAKFFGISLKELLNLLGPGFNLRNLPDEYWTKYRAGLQAAIEPRLEETAIASGLNLQDEIAIGTEFGIFSENVTSWATRYTFDLVRGLTDTTQRGLQKAIPAFFSEGLTREELERRILETGIEDLEIQIGNKVKRLYSKQRASMIAVTETTRAASQGEQITALEIEKDNPMIQMVPVWNTNNDELVCPICGPRNQKEIKPDNETNGEFPPAHVNCILPGNEVVPVGSISAATKSFYHGPCVEITLANGRRISVTENHMILTSHGWIKAKFANKIDNIITSGHGQRIAPIVNPHNNNRPTRIEKIFSSMEESVFMRSITVPSSPKQFHGDGRLMNGEIKIVYPNSFLGRITEIEKVAIPRKITPEHTFICGHSASDFFSPGLGSLFLPGFGNTTNSGMGGDGLISPLFSGHSRPLDKFSFGSTPRLNPMLNKVTLDNITPDTYNASKFLDRFASQVSFDKVVKIRNFNFSGHVYDLQCDDYGLYITNGIITHNCRCWVSHEAKLRE